MPKREQGTWLKSKTGTKPLAKPPGQGPQSLSPLDASHPVISSTDFYFHLEHACPYLQGSELPLRQISFNSETIKRLFVGLRFSVVSPTRW